MTFFLNAYKSFLKRWPVSVQAVQAGALMGVGDVLAQTFVEKKEVRNINWKRTLQFSSVGFFVIGPPLRVWYGVLDKYVGGSGRLVAVKKAAIDQLLFAPFFIVCVMGSIGAVQGQDFNEIKARLRRDYTDVLQTNYKIWPAVQLANFYLIPLQYQVLTVQVVAVFWNTYLSWKTNQELERHTAVT